jgi:PQQ-dependent dehydrogenase (methanol/ethanol family)
VLALIGFARRFTRNPDTIPEIEGEAAQDWLSYGLNASETRYSPLKQINAANVHRLGLQWSFEVGPGGGAQQATPLVAHGTIYSITNWSVVFAVDARTGKEKWRWDPRVDRPSLLRKISGGVVNRGVAIYENLIIAPVIDGRLQAHDIQTGKLIWAAQVASAQDEHTITMAPRIAKGKVIIGVSGGDRPTRGFFAAYDAATGRQAWKFYTVPGNPSKGFENAAMEKAAETWEGEWWRYGGGGAVWDGAAYDPDAGLVYVGTGNPEPWPTLLRQPKDSEGKPKDNLYTCSILAVRVDDGQLAWYYQAVPADAWDYDNVQQLILADVKINGRQRKVIMQAAKNGFFYVLDRITGSFISAQPFSQVTWAKGIDPDTGRPIINPEAMYGRNAVTVTPGPTGAHNWSPMSFNPVTGLVYIPTWVLPFAFASVEEFNPNGQITGTIRPAPQPKLPPPPAIGPTPVNSPASGSLVAWDPAAQKMRWRTPEGAALGGGTLTTAGNLVFQTINDGRILVYSADKGEKLFEIQTGLRSGMGPPITYALGGKQYLALMGGVGEVPPGHAGPANTATPFSPKLLVFGLDGKAPLP